MREDVLSKLLDKLDMEKHLPIQKKGTTKTDENIKKIEDLEGFIIDMLTKILKLVCRLILLLTVLLSKDKALDRHRTSYKSWNEISIFIKSEIFIKPTQISEMISEL